MIFRDEDAKPLPITPDDIGRTARRRDGELVALVEHVVTPLGDAYWASNGASYACNGQIFGIDMSIGFHALESWADDEEKSEERQ
jgi:hypothetical protein